MLCHFDSVSLPQIEDRHRRRNFSDCITRNWYSLTDGLGHLGGVVGISILIPLTAYVGAKYAFPILGIPVIIAGLIVIALIPRTVGKRLEEVNETFVGTGKPVPTARSLSESDTQGTRPS
jgi:hypothetical protein